MRSMYSALTVGFDCFLYHFSKIICIAIMTIIMINDDWADFYFAFYYLAFKGGVCLFLLCIGWRIFT